MFHLQDPGVAKNEPPGTYPPYDLGMQYDLFIKKEDGTPIVGEVKMLKYCSNM